MSAHFLILLKNWIRLSLHDLSRRVRETPLPSMTAEEEVASPLAPADPAAAAADPTVGRLELRQATYREHASQCSWLPCE